MLYTVGTASVNFQRDVINANPNFVNQRDFAVSGGHNQSVIIQNIGPDNLFVETGENTITGTSSFPADSVVSTQIKAGGQVLVNMHDLDNLNMISDGSAEIRFNFTQARGLIVENPPVADPEMLELLEEIRDAVLNQKDWEHVLFQDENTDFYYEKIIEYPQDGGAPVITWIPLNGGPNPPVNPIPAVDKDRELDKTCYKATVAGTGYSIGDKIIRLDFYDVTKTPINTTPVATVYKNLNTGLSITPNMADLVLCTDFIQERTHVGEQTLALALGSTVTLTPPTGANHAEIQISGAKVRWGYSATKHKFTPYSFFEIEIESLDAINKFQVEALGSGGTLAVDYFYVPNVPVANV